MTTDPEMQEIVSLFLQETCEGLDTMEAMLLVLDSNADREAINTIFRAAHSIKGGAATFGLRQIADFTHGAETLLDRMRTGHRPVTGEAVQALLAAVDLLRSLTADVGAGRESSGERIQAISADIAGLLAESLPQHVTDEVKRPAADAQVSAKSSRLWELALPANAVLAGATDPLRLIRELQRLGDLDIKADVAEVPALEELDPLTCHIGWRILMKGEVHRAALVEVLAWVDDVEIKDLTPSLAALPSAPPTPTLAASPANVASEPPRTGVDGGSIRVSTAKVDQLVNLVGELVITQSILSQFGEEIRGDQVEKLRDGLSQLARNTRDLQESVMQMRMRQISSAFNRIPRIVHDLSHRLGKTVQLKLTGESTELDKTVLEKISDPLVHLVRNSLDHGLETPAARRAAGKGECGTLELAAFHEGGNIVIEVKDDGGGLNRKRIVQRAKERALIEPEAVLTDDEIDNLIFEPGFSTAEAVSDVSGRGVGMDVVRRNIMELGGHVAIQSVEGRGSTVRIRLPLTLAILEGQLVRVGDATYVLPIASMIESVPAQGRNRHSVPGGATLFQVRGDYLPLVRLREEFGMMIPTTANGQEGLVVIVESDGARCGLLVDELLAQQQVVVKSLEANFQAVRGITGATILADGRVALIVDLPAIVRSLARDDRSRRLVSSQSKPIAIPERVSP